MIEQIRQFLVSLGGLTEEDERDAHDPRVAAAALLVHVGRADGQLSDEEKSRLETLLARKFDLDAAQAKRIARAGREAERDAVDLFRFTSVLMTHLSEEQRIAFVHFLWELCLVDGELHELEDNLVWRISELLAVPGRERMLAKQAALRRQDEA